jgi:hypothetical protein
MKIQTPGHFRPLLPHRPLSTHQCTCTVEAVNNNVLTLTAAQRFVDPLTPLALYSNSIIHCPLSIVHRRVNASSIGPSLSVSSSDLESWYEFVGTTLQAPEQSNAVCVLSFDNPAEFVRTFRFLTKHDIKTHDLSAPPSFRDDTARARLLNHCCNDDCRGSRYLLVFRRLAGKRRLNRTQFETPLPTTGVPSPRMLKILYSNEPGASQAGVIRSFTLNKFYRFIYCGTAQELSSLKLATNI